jgi:2-dehydro-3-deoxygluconokinase
MTGARLVAVGECMVELFSEDRVPLDQAELFRCTFGGDALQAALAAANLGTHSALATVAGDDPFADRLVSWVRERGIDPSRVVRRPGFTGLYLISLDAAGERSFVYYRKGSAASTLGEDDVAWPEPPGAVLISGITQAISATSRRAALAAARRSREGGALVAYDVNYRHRLWDPDDARAGFEEVVRFVDVVRISAPEEILLVAGTEDPVAAAIALRAGGPRIVLVGCGAGGAVVAFDRVVERIPAPPVDAIDSTGAGDALTGGFLHGLLEGMDPVAAARLGVAAGSLAVTRRGGAVAMPPGDEVRALVASMERTAVGA